VARDVDDEVRRMLEDELHGGRRVDTGQTARPVDGPEKEMADARALIADRVQREGIENPSPSALDEAARMMVEREETHPTTAYERAVTRQGQEAPGGAQATFRSLDERTRRAYEAGTGSDAEDFFNLAGAAHDARRGAAEEMATGKGVRLEHNRTTDLSAMVTRNTDDEGPWRITYINKDGPIGHRVFDSQQEAIDDALKEGYRVKSTEADVPFEGGGRVEPPVDEAITQRQREARRHWKENVKQPYELEPVAGVVERAPLSASGFEMTSGGVAETAFQAGNKGAEGIRALRAAGATDAALAEAAALSFSDPRRGVVRDGVIDPNGFRRWLNNYGPAINELPPAVRQRLQSAYTATTLLERVTEARAAALDAFDQRAVGKLLGVPTENLPNAIRSRLENPAAINDLMAGVANNPQAKAGLQRLVADHITQRFTNASEMISKNALTNFVKDHRAQLTAIFGQEGAERFRRLAADIERSRKQMTVGKDPAGPGTAGDLWKAAAGETSIMTLVAGLAGAPGVAAYGVAKHLAGNMRLAGIKGRDELYARALLDPDLARQLLTRAPALKNKKFVNGLGRSILRSSLAGMAYGGNQ
jgi:hypothetical protein